MTEKTISDLTATLYHLIGDRADEYGLFDHPDIDRLMTLVYVLTYQKYEQPEGVYDLLTQWRYLMDDYGRNYMGDPEESNQ